MAYHHLTQEERYQIYAFRKAGRRPHLRLFPPHQHPASTGLPGAARRESGESHSNVDAL